MVNYTLLAIFCFDSWEMFRLVFFILSPALGFVQSSSNSHDDKDSPLTWESVTVVIPLSGWPDYKSFHSRQHDERHDPFLSSTSRSVALGWDALWNFSLPLLTRKQLELLFFCFFEPMRTHWLAEEFRIYFDPSGWNSFSRMRVPITVPLGSGRAWVRRGLDHKSNSVRPLP